MAAGRQLFGTSGFAATSVEDIARAARVTTGALYHHFPTKAAVFEAVFEQVHADLLAASVTAAAGAANAIDLLAAGFGAFLDKVLEPEVQQIIITDAPAVLGLARFTELDERYGLRRHRRGDRGRQRVGGPARRRPADARPPAVRRADPGRSADRQLARAGRHPRRRRRDAARHDQRFRG